MLTLTCSVCLALPSIWIVDASNGPGTHFLDVPAAVAAAVSGDTILVRPGNYTSFSVSGKALTIRGAGESSTLLLGPSLHIAATPPGEVFVLSGMRLLSPAYEPALTVDQLARISLLDCVLQGAWPSGDGLLVQTGEVHAARCSFYGGASDGLLFAGRAAVSMSAQLAADACTFVGGRGLVSQSLPSPGADYGAGLSLSSSHVSLARCTCRGGDTLGLPGAAAVVVTGSTLRIAGTTNDVVQAGTSMFATTPAEPSLWSIGSAVTVHGNVSVLGSASGGPATQGPVTRNATVLPYLTVFGPKHPSGEHLSGATSVADLDGLVPNAPFFFLFAAAPVYADLAPVAIGELQADLATGFLIAGTLDAQGHVRIPFSFDAVPLLLDRVLYAQGALFDPTSFELKLSNGDLRIYSH